MSKKKIKEIMRVLYEEVLSNQVDWIASIDSAIYSAIEGTAFDKGEEASPDQPDSFFCKYFE